MGEWALDLGTTNTGLARWDVESGRPQLLELEGISRKVDGPDLLEVPKLLPSATLVLRGDDLPTRIGRRPFFARRTFLGKQAEIGRPAIEMQELGTSPAFVPTFKPFLEREPLRTVARVHGKAYAARDVARMFVRELLAEVKRGTGERIRDLVVTAPVDAYESYRAELSSLARHLGIDRLRFLDEPIAAALGYGLGLTRERTVVVVDIGGGTMHVALVRLSPKQVESGSCHVIAKRGRAIGGNVVDRWLLRAFCDKLGYPLDEEAEDATTTYWTRELLQETCRVKEALHVREADTFRLTPREDPRSLQVRLRRGSTELAVSRADAVEILRAAGFHRALEECVDGVIADAKAAAGFDIAAVDDVLMVGGSSLLPGVYGIAESRFGRDRVRAWQPFEAVAYGGAVFAAGAFGQSDFIVHDYAFVTHDPKTHQPQYTVIVPRGTRFPTAAGFWKRQLVPTCSLGEPESIFKLLVCEIGQGATHEERRFAFDAAGAMRKLGGRGASAAAEPMVVPLNETNPTLGRLDPPHPPTDKQPRLEIAFDVNADRWLCATVTDLKTRKALMTGTPVVRLL